MITVASEPSYATAEPNRSQHKIRSTEAKALIFDVRASH